VSLEEFFTEITGLLKANGCQVENLSTDMRLEELEMNSVNLTAALLELEDHFEVLVPDETWTAWQTIEDIVNYIAEYKQTQKILKLSQPQEQKDTE